MTILLSILLLLPSIGQTPETHMTPHRTLYVASAGYIFIIAHRRYRGYINGGCHLRIRGSRAKGCYVTSSVTAYVSKGVIGLFTGIDASGCLAAAARFRGEIYAGRIIPVRYYATNNC